MGDVRLFKCFKGSLCTENGQITRLELVSTFLWTKKYDAVVPSLLIQCWKAFWMCKTLESELGDFLE